MDVVFVLFVAINAVITVVHGGFAWIWPRSRRDRVVRDFAASRSLVLDADAAALAERLLVAGRKGRGSASRSTSPPTPSVGAGWRSAGQSAWRRWLRPSLPLVSSFERRTLPPPQRYWPCATSSCPIS